MPISIQFGIRMLNELRKKIDSIFLLDEKDGLKRRIRGTTTTTNELLQYA
jgi:hypothetical protein